MQLAENIGKATDKRPRCESCNRPINGRAHEYKGKIYGPICVDRIKKADALGLEREQPVFQEDFSKE